MSIRHNTIRLHLLALVLAIGIPLGCALAEGLRGEIKRDQDSVFQKVTLLAQLAAAQFQTGNVHIDLPPGSLWIVENQKAEIVASSLAHTPVQATEQNDIELIALALHRRSGYAQSQAFDGENRLFGFSFIGDTGNLMLVGVPSRTAFAATRAHAWRHSILLMLILGMACYFAILLSRHLEKPIYALEAASRRMMNGDLSQEVSISGPVELQQVARQFNEMQQGLQRAEVERHQYEADLLRSREELRSLAGRLESMIEAERTRIAREIHDDLGQALTILRLDVFDLKRYLATVEISAATGQAVETRLTSMVDLLGQTLGTVRRIATELRPAVLDLGLESAAEWLLHDFESHTGIRCEMRCNLEGRTLPAGHSTALFRILQEALTNVARHAGASRVAVEIRAETPGSEAEVPRVALHVHDNGCGISDADLTARGSLGLIGMRERAMILNGEFNIEGLPDEGTSICVVLPLPANVPIGAEGDVHS